MAWHLVGGGLEGVGAYVERIASLLEGEVVGGLEGAALGEVGTEAELFVLDEACHGKVVALDLEVVAGVEGKFFATVGVDGM